MNKKNAAQCATCEVPPKERSCMTPAGKGGRKCPTLGAKKLREKARLEYKGDDLREGNYYVAPGEAYKLKVAKTVSVKPDSQEMEIEYKVTNIDTREFEPWFGVEFNYSLKDPHLNKVGEAHGLTNINVNDQWYGVKIDFELSKAADLWYFPIETVSDSDQGLERTYQELSLLFHWKFKLAPREVWGVKIRKNIKIEE